MRVLALLVLLLVVGGVYYFGLRRVHFSGSSPMAVELRIPDWASTNIYRVSITNRSVCERLVSELRQASPAFGGSKVVGELTFRYADGVTNVVYLLPGPYQQYTLLQSGTFTVATNGLFRVLADGGVDLSKIP
jgi:hypothetical protein